MALYLNRSRFARSVFSGIVNGNEYANVNDAIEQYSYRDLHEGLDTDRLTEAKCLCVSKLSKNV